MFNYYACTFVEHDGTTTRVRFTSLHWARHAAHVANRSLCYRAAWASRW